MMTIIIVETDNFGSVEMSTFKKYGKTFVTVFNTLFWGVLVGTK